MVTKVPITNDEVLLPGDKLELVFKLSGPLWLRATESAAIENRISRKFDNFRVDGYRWEEDKFIVNVTVIEPVKQEGQVVEAGVPVTAIVISAAILGIGLIYLFTHETTYKIVETAAPALSLAAIAVILYFALRLFGKGGLTK